MERRLTTHLIMDAILDGATTLAAMEAKLDYEAIQEAITAFDRQVWFGAGLQEYVQNATKKGHRCQSAEQIDILLYAIAGRVLITFRDLRNESEITLITGKDETTPRMGMQSINATKDEALRFIQGAIRLARNGVLHFVPYEGASIG